MSYFRVDLSAEGAKNASQPWLSPLQVSGSLAMTSTCKFVCMTHHFILLRLNPFELRFDSEGWWFEHSMSQFRVFLSVGGAKNLSWCCPSTLRGWGSLTMTSTVEFVCMAHQFILLLLIPFGFRVDSGGWWFEHSMSKLRICLSAEGAENFSSRWLSPLRG